MTGHRQRIDLTPWGFRPASHHPTPAEAPGESVALFANRRAAHSQPGRCHLSAAARPTRGARGRLSCQQAAANPAATLHQKPNARLWPSNWVPKTTGTPSARSMCTGASPAARTARPLHPRLWRWHPPGSGRPRPRRGRRFQLATLTSAWRSAVARRVRRWPAQAGPGAGVRRCIRA